MSTTQRRDDHDTSAATSTTRTSPTTATETSATVVSARNLVKRYGEIEAVAGLSFEVHAGEFFGMLGPNGAGKSTTMRMLYRVTPLTQGSLSILGFEAGRDDRQIKARLGVVPQIDNLDEELSVIDNLIVYARFHDIGYREAKARAHELLDFMELSGKANAKVMALSGGMKRRLTLARGLMNDPQIVILDEPTTGLDPQVRIVLWDKLEELRARGVTLLMSTHYMDEAERLCDRLIIMDQGRIVAVGDPERLVDEHVSAEVVEVRLAGMDAERLTRVAQRLGAGVQRSKERMSLFTDSGRELIDGLRREGLEPPRIFIRPGNLEDVFLKLTGRSLRE